MLKYVVVVRAGKEEIYLFPRYINHNDFADILSYVKTYPEGSNDWGREFAKPIAAGFTDGTNCWGRSETLNLDSRPELDGDLLLTGTC